MVSMLLRICQKLCLSRFLRGNQRKLFADLCLLQEKVSDHGWFDDGWVEVER